jgi:hypothetical protein
MNGASSGINLIIADSYEEVEAICKILDIGEPSVLKSLESIYILDPDTVFYTVMSYKRHMEEFASIFKLKRCVISHGGVREASGFNLDWLKRILGHKTVKPTVTEVKPTLIGFLQDPDKEDPHVEIGYTR